MERSHKRTTVKVRLKEISSQKVFDKLQLIVADLTYLIDIAYLFIRSFVLYAIENKIKVNMTIELLKTAFKVLIEDNNKGNKIKDATQFDLLQAYFRLFSKQTGYTKMKISKVSHIILSTCEQMYIAIINNIIYNYEKHMRKFIKASFTNEYQTIMNTTDCKTSKKHNENRKHLLTQFHGQMDKIYDDLVQRTQTSDTKYHEWIKINRTGMIPLSHSEKSFNGNVKRNTMQYLECMYFMTNKVHQSNLKTYQFFPLRTSYRKCHISINTAALINIFHGDLQGYPGKLACLGMSGDPLFQERIWNDVFNLKNANNGTYMYHRPNYSFNYELETDGYAVSLNFIHNNEIPIKMRKKENFAKGRKESFNKKIELGKENYDKYLQNKLNTKLIKEAEIECKLDEYKKQQKNKFKQMSDIEKEKIIDKANAHKEFPYIEKVIKDDEVRINLLDSWTKGEIIFCDPGKRSPLYLMGSNNISKLNKDKLSYFGISNYNCLRKYDKGLKDIGNHKFMNYTTKTRLVFTKRLKYGKLIEKWKSADLSKNQNNIINKMVYNIINKSNTQNKSLKWFTETVKDLEVKLAKENSKSCNHKDFLRYVKLKINLLNKIKYQYDTEYLEKLNWHSYLNKQKHETNLIRKIKNEFGLYAKIIMGDWSNNGRLKFISTPNLSLKRKLKDHFEVYDIDEYRTSFIHYKTNANCNKMSVNINSSNSNDQTNVLKQLHAVLTYKIVNEEVAGKNILSGCINRDKNSVLNMERIFRNLLSVKSRPALFSRKKLDRTLFYDALGNPLTATGTLRKKTINSKQLPSNNIKNTRTRINTKITQLNSDTVSQKTKRIRQLKNTRVKKSVNQTS